MHPALPALLRTLLDLFFLQDKGDHVPLVGLLLLPHDFIQQEVFLAGPFFSREHYNFLRLEKYFSDSTLVFLWMNLEGGASPEEFHLWEIVAKFLISTACILDVFVSQKASRRRESTGTLRQDLAGESDRLHY